VNPAGTVEPVWLVSSTQGLPTPALNATAYMLIDGEIVGYTGFNPAGNGIVDVIRGALNTNPAAHSTGTYMAPQILQGQTNLAAMRLDLWSSEFEVQLSAIKFNRSLPLGLNGDDPDVSLIRVYKSGDGVFHRDAASGLNVSDIPVGSSYFGAPPEASGRVEIPINP